MIHFQTTYLPKTSARTTNEYYHFHSTGQGTIHSTTSTQDTHSTQYALCPRITAHTVLRKTLKGRTKIPPVGDGNDNLRCWNKISSTSSQVLHAMTTLVEYGTRCLYEDTNFYFVLIVRSASWWKLKSSHFRQCCEENFCLRVRLMQNHMEIFSTTAKPFV